MKFNGFRSVSEYETECARLGCHTERVPFHSGDERFFVLVTGAPMETATSVQTWHLFPEDESAELLRGIINNPNAPADVNGVPINYLGTLAAHGYFPDEPGKEKKLRKWLMSPEFRRWIEKPAEIRYGKTEPPRRVWLATWCVPDERRREMESEGMIFPAFNGSGYVSDKPHSFGGWRHEGETETTEVNEESAMYANLKALITECKDASLCGLYVGTAQTAFQNGLITESELENLRRTGYHA